MDNMIRTTLIMLTILTIHSAIADPQAKLWYYQVFTPMKLLKAATFVHHHHSVTTTRLTFLSASENYARMIKVPLIPPATIDSDAKLVVKMVVGTDTEIGQGESDPSYVISDGQYFIGAMIRDKNNFNSGAPCLGFEGTSDRIAAHRRQDSELPKSSESKYPGRIEALLSLSDRWGSCFVSLDGGFSREMIYQHKLNPQNGLFLEIYIDSKSEKIAFKYIEVSIVQEN
ncbi:hypothetical protein ACROYT_G001703 [Oculina patagonica]